MNTRLVLLALAALALFAATMYLAVNPLAPNKNAVFESQTVDQAWARVMMIDDIASERDGSDHYFQFLKEVEITKQRRRELGLAFWHEFPDDPRRFTWLIHAVYLAPVYPIDVNAWARAEVAFSTTGTTYPAAATQLYLADVPVDREAIVSWGQTYPDLREAFFASPAVTHDQRRLLREVELRQEAWRIKRIVLRGEELRGHQMFVDRLFEHYATDPDVYRFWSARALTQEVCLNLNVFGLDDAEFVDFAARLRVLSPELEEFVDRALLTDFCSPENRAKAVSADRSEQLFQVANSLISPGAPDIPDEALIFFHTREEAARRRQAMMPVVWDELKPGQKRKLLWNSAASARFYRRMPADVALFVDAFVRPDGVTAGYAIDEAVRNRWAETRGALIADYQTDPSIPREDIVAILGYQLRLDLGREMRGALDGDPNAEVTTYLERVHAFYAEHGDASVPSVFRALRSFSRRATALGFASDDVSRYLSRFDHPRIQELALGRNTREGFRSRAIDIAGPTLADGFVDLTDLRGKTVLLKFWSTNCGSCIAAMPKVQEIYDKYRDRGFEVVAISSDAEKRRKRVEWIVERAGSTWPTIIGDAYFDELNVRFGFGGSVPQYMLLDREGRMIADTDELDYGRNLPPLLEEQFALAPGAP